MQNLKLARTSGIDPMKTCKLVIALSNGLKIPSININRLMTIGNCDIQVKDLKYATSSCDYTFTNVCRFGANLK